jgi:hypothetical protein
MIRSLLLSACVLLVSFTAATAQITGSIDEDGFIVISGNGESLVGVDFISEGGFLIPIPPGDLTAPADPFQFLLANSPTQVTFGNLSPASDVVVDGDLVLSVGYDALGQDLRAEWGSRAADIPTGFPVVLRSTVLPEPSGASLAVLSCIPLLLVRRRRGKG